MPHDPPADGENAAATLIRSCAIGYLLCQVVTYCSVAADNETRASMRVSPASMWATRGIPTKQSRAPSDRTNAMRTCPYINEVAPGNLRVRAAPLQQETIRFPRDSRCGV